MILSPSQYYHCEELEWGMTGSYSNGRKDRPDPFKYPFQPGDEYMIDGVVRRAILSINMDDIHYHDVLRDDVFVCRYGTFMHWITRKGATKK